MNIEFFWNVLSFQLVNNYRSFEAAYCLLSSTNYENKIKIYLYEL